MVEHSHGSTLRTREARCSATCETATECIQSFSASYAPPAPRVGIRVPICSRTTSDRTVENPRYVTAWSTVRISRRNPEAAEFTTRSSAAESTCSVPTMPATLLAVDPASLSSRRIMCSARGSGGIFSSPRAMSSTIGPFISSSLAERIRAPLGISFGGSGLSGTAMGEARSLPPSHSHGAGVGSGNAVPSSALLPSRPRRDSHTDAPSSPTVTAAMISRVGVMCACVRARLGRSDHKMGLSLHSASRDA
jgi:hypothetical protein